MENNAKEGKQEVAEQKQSESRPLTEQEQKEFRDKLLVDIKEKLGLNSILEYVQHLAKNEPKVPVSTLFAYMILDKETYLEDKMKYLFKSLFVNEWEAVSSFPEFQHPLTWGKTSEGFWKFYGKLTPNPEFLKKIQAQNEKTPLYYVMYRDIRPEFKDKVSCFMFFDDGEVVDNTIWNFEHPTFKALMKLNWKRVFDHDVQGEMISCMLFEEAPKEQTDQKQIDQQQ